MEQLPYSTLHPSLILRPLDDDIDYDDDYDGEGDMGVGGGAHVEVLTPRQNAENALLSSIQREVSRTTWAALTKAMSDLRDKTIAFDSFSYATTSILKNHLPRCRELQDIMRPGTDTYIFTSAEENVRFRPWFNMDDMAMDWELRHSDLFSTRCVLCYGPFSPPIRTLGCKHSFCVSCISKMLETKAEDERKRNREREERPVEFPVVITCPTCIQPSTISSLYEAETLDERSHNSLLLALREATLKYKCPFEGCDRTLVREDWGKHVDACFMRKIICDKGCGEVLHKHSSHWNAHDCVACLKDKVAMKDKEIAELKERVPGWDRDSSSFGGKRSRSARE